MGNALSVQGEPMSSDLVAEGSTLTMDLLPLDVQFQIFLGISELHNYEDAITAIQNLALASKAWYAVFQRHKGLIYRNVALQMMSVKTIRAAKASYFCNFNELTWATTVMQRVIASLRSEAPSDAGLLKENTWTAPMIRSMMRKQRTFRCTAVKIALVSLPEGARDEPTFSELDRIERAIYHTELFFWAQEIRMRFVVSLYPNSPLPHDRIPGWVRSDEAFNDMFTREFSVLEMEQVRCFITILLQHETYCKLRLPSEALQL